MTVYFIHSCTSKLWCQLFRVRCHFKFKHALCIISLPLYLATIGWYRKISSKNKIQDFISSSASHVRKITVLSHLSESCRAKKDMKYQNASGWRAIWRERRCKSRVEKARVHIDYQTLGSLSWSLLGVLSSLPGKLHLKICGTINFSVTAVMLFCLWELQRHNRIQFN